MIKTIDSSCGWYGFWRRFGPRCGGAHEGRLRKITDKNTLHIYDTTLGNWNVK